MHILKFWDHHLQNAYIHRKRELSVHQSQVMNPSACSTAEDKHIFLENDHESNKVDHEFVTINGKSVTIIWMEIDLESSSLYLCSDQKNIKNSTDLGEFGTFSFRIKVFTQNNKVTEIRRKCAQRGPTFRRLSSFIPSRRIIRFSIVESHSLSLTNLYKTQQK